MNESRKDTSPHREETQNPKPVKKRTRTTTKRKNSKKNVPKEQQENRKVVTTDKPCNEKPAKSEGKKNENESEKRSGSSVKINDSKTGKESKKNESKIKSSRGRIKSILKQQKQKTIIHRVMTRNNYEDRLKYLQLSIWRNRNDMHKVDSYKRMILKLEKTVRVV